MDKTISRFPLRWQELIPKTVTCLREGYSLKKFLRDLSAGTTVGIIAIPLAMAFAIASGVPPERGLYTAVIAGFLISLLGGSRVQIGGPTGAFVVIIYSVVERQGYDGLVLATLMAGVLLAILGVIGLGSLIRYIPFPVITGFTTGIAVTIFALQIKDFFGLNIAALPVNFTGKVSSYIDNFHSWDPTTTLLAAGSLAGIIVLRRLKPTWPGGVIVIALAGLLVWICNLQVETIGTRFGHIPSSLPVPGLPTLPWDRFQDLIPDALTIALLAGIESLLSAIIADGMIGGIHKPNCELLAQGIANIGSVFFGGIPATGAIARTAANVKNGGRTPVAGMVHAIVLLIFILLCTPLVEKIPLAALAALLIMVAWTMSEVHHFIHLFKAPMTDVIVLMSVFALTVLVDITVAVEVGMILAALLFMKSMSEMSDAVSRGRIVSAETLANEEIAELRDPEAIENKHVPPGVEVYEINGPFFFGVADRLKTILNQVERPPKVFILRMRKVPVVDATGMHALEEFYLQCRRQNIILLLSGVKSTLKRDLKKYSLDELIGPKHIFTHIDDALERAWVLTHGGQPLPIEQMS